MNLGFVLLFGSNSNRSLNFPLHLFCLRPPKALSTKIERRFQQIIAFLQEIAMSIRASFHSRTESEKSQTCLEDSRIWSYTNQILVADCSRKSVVLSPQKYAGSSEQNFVEFLRGFKTEFEHIPQEDCLCVRIFVADFGRKSIFGWSNFESEFDCFLRAEFERCRYGRFSCGSL